MDNYLVFKNFGGKRLHLGVTGSIAAYKAADLLHPWQNCGLGVSVTLTRAARQFVTPLTFEALGALPVYTDFFQGQSPFEHLEPGQTAQAMIIAPATADIMARVAAGRADDLLAAQILAFDGQIVLAPAMNPRMWQNTATQDNAQTLLRRGFSFVGPENGNVACGEIGNGRLADLRAIHLAGLKALTPQDLEGKTLMLTLGPTRESWDDVRFWSNSSTGQMGAALAIAAWLRGARVQAVCGPISLWLPDDPMFERHNVQSAAQMLEVAANLWPKADQGIFCAAVADFRPEPHGPGKFKKSLAEQGFNLRFLPNQDILRTLAAQKLEEQIVVGFAAESAPNTEALAHAVRRKLLSKKAHMIVGNKISDGFGKADNRVFIADLRGREENWPEMSKPDLAWKILNWMQTL